MNYIQRVELWGDRHHPKWVDMLRIALGIFLFIKGLEFARNSSLVTSLLHDQMRFNTLLVIIVQHYIIYAHIAGGFLIAVGLMTRLASIAQMPIVLGALIFSTYSLFQPLSEIWLTLFILLLLIFFFVEGNGPWSLDHFIDRENETQK